MRRASVLGLIGAATVLGGCVIYANEGGEDVSVHMASSRSSAPAASAETVRAVRFDGMAMHVRVDSNGCTDASSFEVEISGSDPALVILNRARPDLCKALIADGVEVSWTYGELGLTSGEGVRLANPLRL